MSFLIAYFGNEPENMACALCSSRAALYLRGQARPDGWGLGFVQGGDVLLQKRPRTATGSGEVDLYGLVKDLRADAFIGRVGLGQDGNAAAEDAAPFRFRSWLFGSIGAVDARAFESVREKSLESVPTFLRRNIRGKSPSEHVFHLFLGFLHEAGILEQPSPAPDVVRGALRDSVTSLERLLEGTGDAPLRLALAATNGRSFVATSCRFPMRYLSVEGISDCPICHGRVDLDHKGRRIPHESLRAVTVEANAEIAGRPSWHELPDRSALCIGADRAPQILPL